MMWLWLIMAFDVGFCLGSFLFRKLQQMELERERSIGYFEGSSESFEHHAWRARSAFDAGSLLRYDHLDNVYRFIGESTPFGAWKTRDEAFHALWLHQSTQEAGR